MRSVNVDLCAIESVSFDIIFITTEFAETGVSRRSTDGVSLRCGLNYKGVPSKRHVQVNNNNALIIRSTEFIRRR